jgi:uncharacterized membrane protein
LCANTENIVQEKSEADMTKQDALYNNVMMLKRSKFPAKTTQNINSHLPSHITKSEREGGPIIQCTMEIGEEKVLGLLHLQIIVLTIFLNIVHI